MTVRLTPAARVSFHDLGTRRGELIRTEAGWALVQWPAAKDGETWLPAERVIVEEEA